MAGKNENLGGISIRVTADASQIKSTINNELTGLKNETVKIPITIDDGGKITELRKKLSGLDVPISVKINRETARSLKRDIQTRLEGEGGVQIPVKIKSFTSGEAQHVRDSIASQLQGIEVSVGVRWHWIDGPPPGDVGPGGPGGVAGGPMGMPGGSGGRWVYRGEAGSVLPGGVRAGGMAGAVAGAAGAMRQPQPGEALPRQTPDRAEPPAGRATGPVAGRADGGERQKGRPRSRFRQREDESDEEHRRRLREMQREREQLLQEQGFPTERQGYNQSVKAYNDLISIRKRLGEEGPTARLPMLRGSQGPYPERVDAAGRVVRGPAEVTQRLPGTKEDRELPRDQRPIRTKQVPVGPLLSDLSPAERRAAKIRSGLMGPAEGVEYPRERHTTAESQEALRESFGIQIDPETGRVTDIGELGGGAGLRAGPIEYEVQRDLDRKVLEEQESHLADLKRQRTEMEGGLTHPMRSSKYRGVIDEIAKTEPVVKDLRGRQTPRTQRAQRSFLQPGLEATPEQIARARERLGEGASDEDVLFEVEDELREVRQILSEARQKPNEAWQSFTKSQRRNEKGQFKSKDDQRAAFMELLDRPVPGQERGGVFSEAQQLLEAGDLEGAYTLARDARTALLGAAFAGGVIPGVAAGTAKRYLDPKRDDMPTAGTPEQKQAQIEFAEQMDALGSIQTEVRRQRGLAEAQARRSWGGQQAAETRRGETTGVVPRHPGGQRFTSREMRQRTIRARTPVEALDPDDPRMQEVAGLLQHRDALLAQADQERMRLAPRVDEGLVGFLNKAGGPPLERDTGPLTRREWNEQGRREAVQQMRPDQLVPFREIDREKTPKLASEPEYLDQLQDQIAAEGGIREPLEIIYDPETMRATLAEGNHRLAIALREGLENVPVTMSEGTVGPQEGAPYEPGDFPARQAPPTNLERLRNLTQQLSSATSDEEIQDLIKGATLAGGPEDAPKSFQAIEGALISISSRFRPDASDKDREIGRKSIEELQNKLGRSPEEIATTHVSSPDMSAVRDLEQEARRADVSARWLHRRQIRAQRDGIELGQEPMAMAAGPTMPPGGVPPGGGGWEWEPSGGAPGAIHVIVDNWPSWMMSEGGVGGPMGGMTPGQQEQALRGTGGQISDEDMAEAVAQLEAEEAAKKAEKDAEKQAKDQERAEKQAEREARESARAQRIRPDSPRSVANRLIAAGLIGREDAFDITDPTQDLTELSPVEQRRGEIEQQLAMSRQGLPIRGFAVSVAQQLAGGQRGEIYDRFSQAGRRLSEATRLEGDIKDLSKNIELGEKAQGKLNSLKAQGVKLTKEQQNEDKLLTGEIERQREERTVLVQRQQELISEADKMARLTPWEQTRNLGKSLAGSVGGFLAYSTAIGAVGAGLGAIAMGATQAMERLSGYHMATREITNSLSDQARSQQGAVQQTVAQTVAQSNLNEQTYESIRGSLEQRTAVEAGNKAYAEQIKLLHASQNVGDQQRGGFDRGLFETTGGLNLFGVQTPFLGTPSTQELIGQRLEAIPELGDADLGRMGAGGAMNLAGRAVRTTLGTVGAVIRNPTDPGAAIDSVINELTAEIQEGMQRRNDVLDELNRKFEGSGVEFVSNLDAAAGDIDEARRVLEEGGATGIADQLGLRNVSLTEESLRALQAGGPEAVGTALQMFNERDQRPDAGVLLAGLEERVLPALQYQIRQNLQNTLDIFLPAQRGMRYLGQPVAPFGRGLVPLDEEGEINRRGVTGLNISGEGGQFGGVPDAAVDSFSRYRDRAREAIDAINAKAAEGEAVLAQRLGVPESSIAQLRTFGQEINSINQRQADIRLDLQMTQYNRQLFLANRQLGDLAGLTGRAGATQVGLLQRQDLMLSRRSQALSLQTQQLGLQTQQLQLQSAELGQQQNLIQLERAQRQVNFQRAIAGFTAPGTTPEERAARIEEAKVEADYAQREIDFQRQQLSIQQKTLAINREQFGLQQQSAALAQQQFENQVALQDAMNNRAYEDQLAAIAEMEKAFAAAQELQALENLKSLITEQRDLFMEEMQAQVAAEEEFIKAQAQFASDIMSQTGEFVQDVVSQVGEVFQKVATAWARSSLGRMLGAPTPAGDRGPENPELGAADRFTQQQSTSSQYTNSGGRAAGFSGRIGSPTTITVGEAGTEEIAILRNPRQVFAGGGGGGVQFFIPVTITGNNIKTDDEAELAVWAEKLTRAVEERLGRRAAQQGFRGV